jgi:peptidoglycan-N-acetylglucosamine deacetylase
MTSVMWLITIFAAILFVGYGLPMAVRVLQVWRLERRCRKTKSVVLTFDDGPGRETTAQLASLLQEKGVRATFFVLGFRGASEPELLKELDRAGHEIGSHSRNHAHAWKTLPWVSTFDYIRGVAFLRAHGFKKRLFRPPFGKWTFSTMVLAWVRRTPVAWWTVDSCDTHTPLPGDPCAISDRLIARGGGVVLMHDFDRQTADAEQRREYVLNTTRAVISAARENGLTIRTYSELFGPIDRSTQE